MEKSSPTSDRTPKRLAHLVALSRLTREGRGKLFHSVPSGSPSVMDATIRAMSRIFNLLYRRFPIGRAPSSPSGLGLGDAPQNTILRYGRVQLCATSFVVHPADQAVKSLALRNGRSRNRACAAPVPRFFSASSFPGWFCVLRISDARAASERSRREWRWPITRSVGARKGVTI